MDINELYPELSIQDIRVLIKRLAFHEEEFNKANLEQAKLSLRASRYRVQVMRLRHKRQGKLEVLRSERALEIRREKHRQKSDARMTESAIGNKVMIDPDVMIARQRLERALELEEFAKGLLEAYRQRQTSLKLITETRNSEIANEIRAVRSRMAEDDVRQLSRKARRVLKHRLDDEVDE